MFSNITAAMPHIKSGKLRALAVTSEQRSRSAPDIPTAIESGVAGYSVTSWYGLLAPARTPQPIVSRLNADVIKVMRLPDMVSRLSGEGAEPSPGTPGEFAALLKAEIAKWGKVIRSAGLAGTE
jgi:tripartite-type tricarboxylate transporter receptor subunit TctC